jgi:hypothetical protein
MKWLILIKLKNIPYHIFLFGEFSIYNTTYFKNIDSITMGLR